ncbi:hypothetical protein BX666DRAFT_684680 [Dichotomocladium elegans]|nr:hypothetical protein BX666DRAFT_684680 [Dichotomocladium elegans]
MPSATILSEEDKQLVRNAVPTSKITTAAVARLFVASPDPNRWSYSNVWGAAAFYLENQRGVLWEQELYEGFDYTNDKPFFHTFETDDYLAGLLFVDEGEADRFYKKVMHRNSRRTHDASDRIKLPKVGGSRKSLAAEGFWNH